VGIANNILGKDYRLEMAELNAVSLEKLRFILSGAGLESLTSVHNPLDITPMASENVYLDVITILLEDENTDAVVVAIVPLPPLLHTLPEELARDNAFSSENSIVERISVLNRASSKPLVVVVDSGRL